MLLLLSPFLVLLTIILWFANKGKPFFFQRRPGLHEKDFVLIKFRTMKDIYDAEGRLESDAERMTSFGSWLRKTSLDELPQLVNVLKGEMSFVGPRPLLTEYLPRYSEKQRKRHDVKPGITGWAQVNGRNAIGWDQKFELDAWYATHCSLPLDIRIIILTIINVLKAKNISSPVSVTMEKFQPQSK